MKKFNIEGVTYLFPTTESEYLTFLDTSQDAQIDAFSNLSLLDILKLKYSDYIIEQLTDVDDGYMIILAPQHSFDVYALIHSNKPMTTFERFADFKMINLPEFVFVVLQDDPFDSFNDNPDGDYVVYDVAWKGTYDDFLRSLLQLQDDIPKNYLQNFVDEIS